MWSKCEVVECSWGEKENKRKGDKDRTLDTGHLSGGEKQEKKKEMKHRDENEMKERKII